MFKKVAAQAALRAYADALAAGGAADVSVGVALARYRSFFPLAPEHKVRDVLARALAVERLRRQGAIFGVDDIRLQEARLRTEMSLREMAVLVQPS
jgi:hypothetical protein